MINDLLFVYGTLLVQENEFARYLTNNSIFYGGGKINGKLYDIGHYPGVVVDKDGNYPITGSIYQLKNAAEVLKKLDPYEGYGEGERLPYLFVRKELPIDTANGPVNCWIYIYNRAVDKFKQVPSGDYLAYKAKGNN